MRPSRVLPAALALLPCLAQAEGLRHSYCATYPGIEVEQKARSLEAATRRAALGPRAKAFSAGVSRNGDVAVLMDQGDLVFRSNSVDLHAKGLEFVPGYTVSRVDRPLAAEGSLLRLSDDDSREVALPFAFPFFGRSYDRAFVNSDGNLTFGAADNASTPRTLGRLVNGAPRIAPFLTDLDPSASGRVTTTSAPGSFSVRWTEVPRFGVADKNTFELTLFPDGRIAFAYDATNLTFGVDEGAVGIAAGGGLEGLRTADLSEASGISFTRAVGESFQLEGGIDLAVVAQSFYSTFGDDYQQLIVYTNRNYIPRSRGAFAFETTVRNSIRGTGSAAFDDGATYGSRGTLESMVLMDSAAKYSSDPAMRVLREETSLSVLAHEVGHRWLATARFNDGGTTSAELLGRQQAHWSFFMNSSGSHDEGNQIEDLGNGLFRTGPTSQRYGPLDQYLMGLRPSAEVPPFFFIRTAVPATGEQSAERAPESNVEIRGTRKDVTIADVIAALGPRVPAPAPNPAPWRVAFVYVTDGSSLDAAHIATVERIRSQFEGFFANSTEGRLNIDTRLK